jgi:hypothetical protein
MENCFGILIITSVSIYIGIILYATRQNLPAPLVTQFHKIIACALPNMFTAKPPSKTPFAKAMEYWASISSGEAIEAWTYGEITSPIDPPQIGALGIHNGDLLLIPPYSSSPILLIPLDSIRWICHQNMSWSERDTFATQDALTLHCESNGRWLIYTLSSPQAETIAQRIQNQTQANYKSSYILSGPIPARYKYQDIYGQWKKQESTTLYFAPDRLLSVWHSWIEFSQIQHLALLPDDTLKITYQANGLHVAGLELEHDQAVIWAEMLERATGIAVENLAGRKKKTP